MSTTVPLALPQAELLLLAGMAWVLWMLWRYRWLFGALLVLAVLYMAMTSATTTGPGRGTPSLLTVYHHVDSEDRPRCTKAKVSPGQFDFSGSGLSAFQPPYVPTLKPCLVPFEIRLPGSPLPAGAVPVVGTTGPVLAPSGCVANYDGSPRGHWAITCPGQPGPDVASMYAKGLKTSRLIVQNPHWAGGTR